MNNNHHYDDPYMDYMIYGLLILLLVLCIATSGCAPQSSYNPDIDQYAAQCDNGYAASCITLQAVYQNAQTQAIINNDDTIAARAHWQNYWLSQQQTWNTLNAENNAAIQSSLNRLQPR